MNHANSIQITPAPSTEGIKYAGSKLKLIPHILNLIQSRNVSCVLDGFAGTTRVSQALAKSGFNVISNDVAIWSKTFATCYLKSQYDKEHYQDLISHLNGLRPTSGWFTQNYGGCAKNENAVQADGLKRPWQTHNTQKLDAIRTEIDKLNLGDVEKAVAITSLILALDKVDNTVGHYVSYLKKWSPRSYNQLELKVPQVLPPTDSTRHQVLCSDIFDSLPRLKFDLAYFDPPYGSNNEKMPPSRVRYASYYHLWTTICLNDKPELTGKARRRLDCRDNVVSSVFEEFRRNPNSGRFYAVEAIEKLIQATPARFIVFSYNNSGRATGNELREVLDSAGEVLEVREIDYRRNVMAKMRWTDDWIDKGQPSNQELLFLLEKK